MVKTSPKRPSEPSDRAGYLIPPLPKTKLLPDKDSKARSPLGRSISKKPTAATGIGTRRNQEAIQDRDRGALAPLPFSRNIQLGSHRSSAASATSTADKENARSLLPSFSRRTAPIKASCRPVLRSRETIESVFGLTNQSSEEYRQLCHVVAEGGRSDDAATWRRLLELVRKQENLNQLSGNQKDVVLRLHRRATSRFPVTTPTGTRDPHNVFLIWLSYAEVLALAGETKDSRNIFTLLQENGIAATKASFFLAFASFEKRNSNVEKAQEIIQLGLDQNSQPIQSLTKAAKELLDSVTPSRKKESATKATTAALSARKRPAETTVSPKRRKLGSIAANPNLAWSNREGQGLTSVTLESDVALDEDVSLNRGTAVREIQSHRANLDRSLNGTVKPPFSKFVSDASRSTPTHFHIGSPQMMPSTIDQEVRMGANRNVKGHRSAAKITSKAGLSTQKRPPLLSKTPRLAKLRLTGKAERVETEQSTTMVEADSEDSLTNFKLKMDADDLRYILRWSPGGKPCMSSSSVGGEADQGTTCGEESSSVAEPSNSGPSQSSTKRHDQSTNSGVHSGPSQPSTKSHGHSSIITTHSDPSQPSTKSHGHSSNKSAQSGLCQPSSKSHEHTSNSGAHSNSSQSSTESSRPIKPIQQQPSESPAPLKASTNADFLPLVMENNIIRVKTVPYVKLGVVGKGGSCKVYRALSKDLSVVAIKKVKLKGLDQKAIDGYANEIALLERLKNNPSIIRMHDSEVDLARKAIFVVMEVGEADLSHTLQQQPTSLIDNDPKSRGGKRPSMNFIRLTWQQMLEAVHSIHEARIIHGDLKPQNFLFVRGRLKLIDFGIAKAIQSDDTTNIYRESQIGTLNYMSPEAILDSGGGEPGAPKMKCGRASDIWSLGCILYQMVYGRTPFAELHMIQKLRAITDPNHKICFPSTVDAAAIDAMQQCLRREHRQRPPIVGENGLLNEHIFLNSCE